MATMTIDDVRRLVRQECERAGSVRAWAAKIGTSHVYVADVLAGRRDPGPAILDVLGLEKVVNVTYRRVRRDAR